MCAKPTKRRLPKAHNRLWCCSRKMCAKQKKRRSIKAHKKCRSIMGVSKSNTRRHIGSKEIVLISRKQVQLQCQMKRTGIEIPPWKHWCSNMCGTIIGLHAILCESCRAYNIGYDWLDEVEEQYQLENCDHRCLDVGNSASSAEMELGRHCNDEQIAVDCEMPPKHYLREDESDYCSIVKCYEDILNIGIGT